MPKKCHIAALRKYLTSIKFLPHQGNLEMTSDHSVQKPISESHCVKQLAETRDLHFLNQEDAHIIEPESQHLAPFTAEKLNVNYIGDNWIQTMAAYLRSKSNCH